VCVCARMRGCRGVGVGVWRGVGVGGGGVRMRIGLFALDVVGS
jgi:hypothetical protein